MAKTPVRIDQLPKYLVQYPNKQVALELYRGFSEGFRLQYTGPRISVWSNNLVSAYQHKAQTLQKIQKEIQLGRILGPFSAKPISVLRISPIGLVPKQDGSWRLITNLSFPTGNSVNSYIDPELCKVNYSSLDNVLNMVYKLGVGAKLGKIDISSAFRLLVINPADFDLLGIHFDGKFYIDKCLPMGCSISCSLFEKFATFLHWVVQKLSGLDTLDHYLDDFIFAGASSNNHCSVLMNTFLSVSKELGVPLAENKTTGPTTVINFLGFTIDTILMKVKIPQDKLDRLYLALNSVLLRNKVTLKELESVTGLMAFCSRAIPSARAFIRRFYDLIASINNKKPYHFIRITKEVKEDVTVWLRFLENFNGDYFIPEDCWYSNKTLELFTDSSGNPDLGCGAYFNNLWTQFRWPAGWRNSPLLRNMSLLELIPIILALFIWAPILKNRKVSFHIDNQALVSIVNKRTSKDKQIMKLIRSLVLLTMENNIQFKAFFIEGTKNEIADAISRFQMERFKALAPSAHPVPERIPAEFTTLILDL